MQKIDKIEQLKSLYSLRITLYILEDKKEEVDRCKRLIEFLNFIQMELNKNKTISDYEK